MRSEEEVQEPIDGVTRAAEAVTRTSGSLMSRPQDFGEVFSRQCPACGKTMRLIAMERFAARPGASILKFECICGEVESVQVITEWAERSSGAPLAENKP